VHTDWMTKKIKKQLAKVLSDKKHNTPTLVA
jgi:hypothetical protein